MSKETGKIFASCKIINLFNMHKALSPKIGKNNPIRKNVQKCIVIHRCINRISDKHRKTPIK